MKTLVQRITRHLKAVDLQIRKCRENSRSRDELGEYYLVDLTRNVVMEKHLDPMDFDMPEGIDWDRVEEVLKRRQEGSAVNPPIAQAKTVTTS